MWSSSPFVGVLFRIINFLVLGVILVRLFKKQVLGDIKSNMAARASFIQSLKRQEEELIHKQVALDQQVIDQQVLCEKLLHNIGRWRLAVEQEKHEVDQKKAVFEKQVHERLVIIEHNRVMQQVYAQAVARALNNAERQATQLFMDEQKRVYVLQAMVHNFKKAQS